MLVHALNVFIDVGLDISLTAACLLSSLYFLLTCFTLFTTLRRRSPRSDRVAADGLPFVTVQIPTYNELAVLNCATRCLAFDYPPDRLQILIGDDSNRPDVSEQINRFCADNPRVRVCRRGSNAGYKPGNLNHMLTATRGEYILILDSDFLPDRDFLRRLALPVIEDPSLAGVQSCWRVSNVHQNYTTLMGAGIVNVIHRVILPFLRRSAGASVFCGSAELIRKDLLIALGGWTPGALTEDVDYSLRLIAAGHRIAYLEDLACACEVPYMPHDLFRQQMRWAYGVMRAFMNHGRLLFRSGLAQARVKLAAIGFGSGYLMIALFIVTAIFGALDQLGDPDTSVCAEAHWLDAAADTALNILITCGMLVSSLAASFVAGCSLRNSGRLIIASFTLGFILVFFIGKGLLKAMMGRPMHWFMVRKNGNTIRVAA